MKLIVSIIGSLFLAAFLSLIAWEVFFRLEVR
jgi:hypothetical protein